MSSQNKWTIKGLVNHFVEHFLTKTNGVKNGSYHFVVHFRNGKMEKVEIDLKEYFGSENK